MLKAMEQATEQVIPRAARWSLHGDIIWRLLLAGVRSCPSFLEQPLIAWWAMVVLVMASRQRAAIMDNLKHLRPDDGIFRRIVATWRVFYHFGCITTDSIRSQAGEDVISWEVEGLEHFHVALAKQGPTVLLTAHMGSYDAAASFFAQHMGRTFYTVRLPERSPRLQKLREEGLRRMENADYHTLYNTSENVLAVDLLRAMQNGHLVALQGDRALPGLAVMPVPLAGSAAASWLMPRGPFMLAMAARARCLPAFVLRVGHRRYRVIFKEDFVQERNGSGNKDTDVATLAGRWAAVLQGILEQFPTQWLVFEKAFASPLGGEKQCFPSAATSADDRVVPQAMNRPTAIDRALTPLFSWRDRTSLVRGKDDGVFPARLAAGTCGERYYMGLLILTTCGSAAWQMTHGWPTEVRWPVAIVAAFLLPHLVMMSVAGGLGLVCAKQDLRRWLHIVILLACFFGMSCINVTDDSIWTNWVYDAWLVVIAGNAFAGLYAIKRKVAP